MCNSYSRLIEIETEEQHQLNEVYEKFSDFVKSEMNEKLSPKLYTLKMGLVTKGVELKGLVIGKPLCIMECLCGCWEASKPCLWMGETAPEGSGTLFEG